MKKYVFLVLLLSACATNRFLFTDENGNQIYQADCGGMWNNINMGDCLKLAGETCPLGFNILLANEQIIGSNFGVQNYGNINTNTNAFGQSNFNANANIYGYGNNLYGNAYGNTNSNAYLNSRTSFNSGGFGGGSYNYSRYLIYSCKTQIQEKK